MFVSGFSRACTLVSILLFAPAAGAAIYRCDGAEGPVFRDWPCSAGQRPETVTPQIAQGASLRASERQWLKRRGAERRNRRDAKIAPARGREDKAQARRCWNKQQRLENVRARLRRGYKPSQGDRLRRLRRQYEDYLSRFCD